MEHASLRERLVNYVLIPATVIAVLVLGGVAARNSLQVERAREKTIFDATITLAGERVDRLDNLIVAQDNVVVELVEFPDLSTLSANWLPTAERETPTIISILILDMDHPSHDVLAYSTRTPGPQADAFRRVLVARLLPEMNMAGEVNELRHLHHVVDDTSYLVSYWQRAYLGQRYLVVAWHDVGRLIHDVFPRLYKESNDGNSRMNVVDENGDIIYGPPINVGEFGVLVPFPTTLYNWRLQLALSSSEELSKKVERQRLIELTMVSVVALIALAGLAIVVVASTRERRAAALKGEFVANVSHELKTPLALIRMFGELLLFERVATDAKRKQYLEIIVSESERLTALIENVLDFAKLERGKDAYAFAEEDIGEVVTRAVDISKYRAERDGISLNCRIAPDLPRIVIDARAVELALLNLLDNALKYAKDGGTVEVEVSQASSSIDVRVIDRGPGIPAEERDHIFERFVRGRDAQQKRIRGSGIGLALVKHIAESHHGSVEVESRPVTEDAVPTSDGDEPGQGIGCIFVLRFPLADSPESNSPPS